MTNLELFVHNHFRNFGVDQIPIHFKVLLDPVFTGYNLYIELKGATVQCTQRPRLDMAP